MVVFERCTISTESVSCKSKTEIDDFLRFKYFLIVKNSKEFA